MSIIKHPVIIALLATAVMFSITYYYYNCDNKTIDEKKNKNSKNGKKSKKSKNQGINETIVVSSAIVGLIVWYVATIYFTEKTDETTNINNSNNASNTNGTNTNNELNTNGNTNSVPGKLSELGTVKGTSIIKGTDGGLNGGHMNITSKIPRIDSDDPTRSYNLIGSGLDIPRSELKIPNVLIDYH